MQNIIECVLYLRGKGKPSGAVAIGTLNQCQTALVRPQAHSKCSSGTGFSHDRGSQNLAYLAQLPLLPTKTVAELTVSQLIHDLPRTLLNLGENKCF